MPRILLVEDNDENRDLLSKLLQNNGFDVVTAKDGQEAVNMSKTEKPDLVLMDMIMPVTDGWQATRLIKADPNSARLPVIAINNHRIEGDREKAFEAGCTAYYTLPVDDFKTFLNDIEGFIKAENQAQPKTSPAPTQPVAT